MNRTSLCAVAGLLALGCGGSTPGSADTGQPPAGSDAGTGKFAYYIDDICRGPSGGLDALETTLQVDTTSGLITKDAPDPETPWCQHPTDQSFDISDTRGAYSASGHFEYALNGHQFTITGIAHASAPANTDALFAKATAGFGQLDIRGGGGGVSKARIAVACSGTIAQTGNGVPGIVVERCNGEQICTLAPTIPGFPGGWKPGTTATFDGDTNSPDSVLACLRVSFDAMAGNLGTADTTGSIVVSVDPVP